MEELLVMALEVWTLPAGLNKTLEKLTPIGQEAVLDT